MQCCLCSCGVIDILWLRGVGMRLKTASLVQSLKKAVLAQTIKL